jgi:hypothetical protein
MILLFCLITVFIIYYNVDPGDYITKYFGYSFLLTIIITVFAFLYLLIVLTLSDKVNDKGDSRIVVYHKPIINFPDYQTRIYRNKDSIRFKNKVHEVITGYSHYSAIPSDWDWSLLHVKSINKQINQNEMYAKL